MQVALGLKKRLGDFEQSAGKIDRGARRAFRIARQARADAVRRLRVEVTVASEVLTRAKALYRDDRGAALPFGEMRTKLEHAVEDYVRALEADQHTTARERMCVLLRALHTETVVFRRLIESF
jgi:hypothetical protein